eukprot:93131_1
MASIFFFVYVVLITTINSQQLPTWTAPQPNASLPLGGYTQIPETTNTEIYHGEYPNSTYNHASMIGYLNGTLTVLWKNCQNDEDCNGQKILYSQSNDGKKWTKPEIMFRNLTVPDNTQATMFVGPPIIINNRMYVGASPGLFHSSYNKHTADGTQFCLWSEPINPRNCGPPDGKQYNNTLMIRQILPGIGNIGNVFWASNTPPAQFSAATKYYNIPTVIDMDKQTQNDIALLTKKMDGFCDKQKQIGTLKCETCSHGGCQLYSEINKSLSVGNERSHYVLPSGEKDIILYRSGDYVLYASLRDINNGDNNKWYGPMVTNIPNQNSNINCGILPNKRIYLVSDAVVRPKNDSIETLNFRDPVTIATSIDGYKFDKVNVVMSCTNLSATSTCSPRWPGGGKNPGPSYPQAIAIVDPAPIELQGLYVVATNNKEDVWITHMKFDVIP